LERINWKAVIETTIDLRESRGHHFSDREAVIESIVSAIKDMNNDENILKAINKALESRVVIFTGPSAMVSTQEEKMLNSDVSAFLADTKSYPHAETLVDDMVMLINNGRAKDLPSAYQLALRLHPELQNAA
jgi:hypothetical protein